MRPGRERDQVAASARPWLDLLVSVGVVVGVLGIGQHNSWFLANQLVIFSPLSAFFAFNTTIVTAILAVIRRSRDVIWLGLVHYLMDIPLGAF